MVQQKIVVRLAMVDAKGRSKALKTAVGVSGVQSVALKGDEISVEGDGVDAATLTTVLRKKMGRAELLSVAEKKKESKEDVGKGAGKSVVAMNWPYQVSGLVPQYAYVMPPEPYYHHAPTCSIM